MYFKDLIHKQVYAFCFILYNYSYKLLYTFIYKNIINLNYRVSDKKWEFLFLSSSQIIYSFIRWH